MIRKVRAAHILLLITCVLFLGYSFLVVYAFPNASELLGDIAAELMIILPALIYFWRKDLYWKDEIRFYDISPANIRMALAVMAAAYPCVICLNLISMMFVKNQVTSSMSSMLENGLMAALFTMAFMPAFCEEFLCRGLLYNYYRNISKIKGVILSALIFGMMHMNFNQMPYAVFLGIVFALMCEATGSIQTSMFMHFLMNGFNISLNFFSYYMSENYMEELESSESVYTGFDIQGFLMALIVFIIFAVLTLKLIQKTFKQNGKVMKNELLTISDETEERNIVHNARIIDVWLVIFMIIAIYLTFRLTVWIK